MQKVVLAVESVVLLVGVGWLLWQHAKWRWQRWRDLRQTKHKRRRTLRPVRC
jgi:hypothetical protein